MAGEAEARDLLGHETPEGYGGGQASDARGGIWYEEAWFKEGSQTWVSEALSQVLVDALERRWAPMQQTQKATLVSQLEVRRIHGVSTSIKLPPVTVVDPKDLGLSWTTKTGTSSTTRSRTSE